MFGAVYIDGKKFEVQQIHICPVVPRGYCGTWYGILIDDKTLFTTKVEEVHIDGNPVKLFYGGENGCSIMYQRYMSNLRRSVESDKLETASIQMRNALPKISGTLESILEAIPHLGKHQLAMSNCGYGDSTPIFCFVGIILKKDNQLVLDVFRDEDTAARKTQEVVDFIYSKTMQSKIKKGAKKLSPKAKQEFEKEVRELAKELSINNLEERVSYLEELYNALIA